MEVNHEYHDINIADIWQYERLMFLSVKSSSKLATKIIDKAEAIIIKEGNPSFGINYRDSLDESERMYYERSQKDYAEASKTISDRFETNFFFNRYSCFEYDQHIVITRDNKDFDLWFALKLRQYDSKLSEIKNFLNYQLEASFNNGIDRIVDFLKLIIRQFQLEFLEERVVETVYDWVEINSNFKVENQSKNNRVNDTVEDENEKDELILNINYNQVELFELLQPYFDEKAHEKLNRLLHSETIEGKICFRSNANQFVMILRQLHLNQKIIGTLVNTEKWICQYFSYLKQQQISNFNEENVHKILTKSSYKIPKSKRIDIHGLEYIINKSK